MISKAAAKIILSGEHAVVYGKPAIATPIPRYAYCHIDDCEHNDVEFSCQQFNYHKTTSLTKLHELKQQLLQRYQDYQSGKLAINQILSTPADMGLFAFIHCFDTIGATLSQGLHLKLDSSIPIGCGMGASAAFINSIIRATCDYFNVTLKDQQFVDIAMTAENLQHGNSSGIDVITSFFEQPLYFHGQQHQFIKAPLPPFQIINTGLPTCSTGECVNQVKNHFGADHPIWDEFENTTHALKEAINNQQAQEIPAIIHKNHQLLCEIGVVPKRVKQFIDACEQQGICAKTSGAGAISGENAGMVIAIGNDNLSALCHKYGFDLLSEVDK